MAQVTVQIKRGLSGGLSNLNTLSPGELAITMDDGYIYYGDANNNVKELRLKVQNIDGITVSSSEPQVGDGEDGEFWFTYE